MISEHDESNVIHAGKEKDKQFGALTNPIYYTSTFVFDTVEEGQKRFLGEEEGYIYGRLGNPTIRELERRVAFLERAEDAAATGSGMAAISSAILSCVKNGDHIITSKALYGCTHSFLEHNCHNFGIETSFIDLCNENELVDALQDNTKLIYIETPINPHLQLIDIELLVRFAKEHGITTICDNTFMTPILQKPIQMGVDMTIHSVTKYLNGHGDVLAGIICGTKEKIADIKATTLKDIGGIISPNDAWLVLRGLKTLHIRVERHNENAMKIASFLEQHECIKTVYFPGLESHPQHELAKKQAKGFGAVIAFKIDGSYDEAKSFMNHLKLAKIAVSLGDAETLIQHPASMTHSPYEEADRIEAGITDDLIRISIGLEHFEDIIFDLDQALNTVKSNRKKVKV